MANTGQAMGTLYLVSTPIGNLEDITLRALRILREVSLIAAEDTRHTRCLLNHHNIQTPCRSYHEHNKLTRMDVILTTLAQGDVALVSDAGTPALSDPGFELVSTCIAAGFDVVPVPGPSAPVAALVVSGLPTDRFFYVGFLPRRKNERRALLASLTDIPATLVCFESPHRLTDALDDALAALGDRQIAIARELTKLHEQVLRMRMSQAQQHFRTTQPRGEFTLVIAGATRKSGVQPDSKTASDASSTGPALDEAAVIERLQQLRAEGSSGSAAARTIAREMGVPRRTIYALWLSLQQAENE
jgi:16S rRNA (cytidine1402-2'-O)-methyltransferase